MMGERGEGGGIPSAEIDDRLVDGIGSTRALGRH